MLLEEGMCPCQHALMCSNGPINLQDRAEQQQNRSAMSASAFAS
jgi:hypothetical protein